MARGERNSCFHRQRIIVANDYKRSPRNVRSKRVVKNGYLIRNSDPYLKQNVTRIIFLDEDRSSRKKKKIKEEARFLESSKKNSRRDDQRGSLIYRQNGNKHLPVILRLKKVEILLDTIAELAD